MHLLVNHRIFLACFMALFSFTACFILIKIIQHVAIRFQLMDLPSKDRRVHTLPTPRLGGVGFVLSFFMGVLVLFYLQPSLFNEFKKHPDYFTIFVGIFLTFILGLTDDLFQLKAKHKLIVQIGIAMLVCYLGFSIDSISLGTGYTFKLHSFSYPLTVIFLVGLQNAFNFIDGIDGLAAGVAWIILASIAFLSFFISLSLLGWLSLIMIAALTAFLYFNWSPAKIFMGDSGSLSLGFLLACFSQFPGSVREAPYPIYVVFLFLSLPILDTGIAISRRIVNHIDAFYLRSTSLFNIWKFTKQLFKTIMKPDGDHIHHRLLRRYLSHKKAAKMCYTLAFFGSTCACLCTQAPTSLAWFITLTYCFFVFQFLVSLEYEAFQSKKYRKTQQEEKWKKALQSFESNRL